MNDVSILNTIQENSTITFNCNFTSCWTIAICKCWESNTLYRAKSSGRVANTVVFARYLTDPMTDICSPLLLYFKILSGTFSTPVVGRLIHPVSYACLIVPSVRNSTRLDQSQESPCSFVEGANISSPVNPYE